MLAGPALADVLTQGGEPLGRAALAAGSSMLTFAFAGAALEAALRGGVVRPMGDEGRGGAAP
jgi:hypothetical protein